MKPCSMVLFACGIFLLCAAHLHAQATISGSGVIVGSTATEPTPILGEPYSAREETESSQTLADGTHIHQHSLANKLYRDSQGRTRTETYLPVPPGNSDPPTPVEILIHDPVAGVTYNLNPRDRTAHQMGIAQPSDNAVPAARAPAKPPVAPEPPYPLRVIREDLGAQVMEGLAVEGTRFTTTIPVGALGNDRPMRTVREQWYSRELKRDILMKTSDPRTGEHEIRLTNIDRSEPDPALFQIPPDYTIEQQQ